jgi:hypothetical protein
MTTNTVKYTAEQVATMADVYTRSPTPDTVQDLATAFGRTTKSIVAKLAQLQIYKKSEKVATATSAVTKLQLAQTLAPNDEAMQNDLVKLTKATLIKLQAANVADAE